MRTYRTTTSFEDSHEELRLDEDGKEFESIERESYYVHLSVDEYKNNEHAIGHIIESAIEQGIDVYTGYDLLGKFKICGDELVTTCDIVLGFTTIIDDNEHEEGAKSVKSDNLEKIIMTLATIIKDRQKQHMQTMSQ